MLLQDARGRGYVLDFFEEGVQQVQRIMDWGRERAVNC